jgi:hypothetical protein
MHEVRSVLAASLFLAATACQSNPEGAVAPEAGSSQPAPSSTGAGPASALASTPAGPSAPAPDVPAPPPARVAATDFDTSCVKDDDCLPAPGCCPVPCTSHVVNRRELDRIREHNAKICPKPPQCMSAGGCRTHAYLCVNKTCKMVHEGEPGYHPRP